MTLATISKTLSIPKTSSLDILKALHETGYVNMEDSELVCYTLGLRAFQLGQKYLRNVNAFKLMEPHLDGLANRLHKTLFLAVLQGNQVVYLAKREPDAGFMGIASTGLSQPAYCTGLGKAMLATFADRDVRNRMGDIYPKKTENTITTYAALSEELEKIRQRGYSIDDCENEPMIYCVALPIVDAEGKAVLGVSAVGVKGQYEAEAEREAAKALGALALETSHKLGFKGNRLYRL